LFDGKVLKCAGFGAEDPEHRKFYEDYYRRNGDNDPDKTSDVVVLEGFRGDRIWKVKGEWVDFDA